MDHFQSEKNAKRRSFTSSAKQHFPDDKDYGEGQDDISPKKSSRSINKLETFLQQNSKNKVSSATHGRIYLLDPELKEIKKTSSEIVRKLMTEEENKLAYSDTEMENSTVQVLNEIIKLDRADQTGLENVSRVSSESDVEKCRSICREKQCLNTSFRLPFIRSNKQRELEWDIKALSNTITYARRGIKSIAAVSSKRKAKHEMILEEMQEEMNKINNCIEEEIRNHSNNLVLQIKIIKDNIEYTIQKIEENELPLTATILSKLHSTIYDLNQNRIYKIEILSDIMRKLERGRTKKFQTVLKKAYNLINWNSYLLPLEIQQFFEEKVTHINQITLSNYHCYTELEGKLKLQMEEDLRIWFQKIELIKQNKNRQFQPITNNVAENKVEDYQKSNILIIMRTNKENVEILFQNTERLMKKIEFLTVNPLITILKNYLIEIDYATKDFLNSRFISKHGIVIDQNELITIAEKNNIHPLDLRNSWIKKINEQMEKINDNFIFFKNAIKLWDFYLDRHEELMLLFNQQMFLTLSKHDKAAFELNKNLNLQIDQLRQETLENTLNASLSTIKSTIDDIESLCCAQHKEEELLVENTEQTLKNINVPLLIDEIKRFLEQYLPPKENDPRVMKKRLSWMDVEERKTDYHLLPSGFLEIQYMVYNINNWKFGVWTALEGSTKASEEAITKFLSSWLDKEKNKLKNRLEVRLLSNRTRFKSIKADFYNVRKAELLFHEERYNEHEMGVNNHLKEMKLFKVEFEEQLQKFIESSYNNMLETSEESIKNIKKKRHVISIISKLKLKDAEICMEIKNKLKYFTTKFNEKLMELKNSHIYFMNSLKLFHEDGNFSAEEAKSFLKKSSVLEKNILKEMIELKSVPAVLDVKFYSLCESRKNILMGKLIKIRSDFDFINSVEEEIKKLHNTFCNEIFSIRIRMKKLNVNIRALIETSQSGENIGNYDFIDTFVVSFRKILEDLMSFQSNLVTASNTEVLGFHSSSKPLSSSLVKTAKTSDSKSNKSLNEDKKNSQKFEKIKKRRASTTSTNTRDLMYKNHSFILYPMEPKIDNSYISEIHHHIFVSYNKVQNLSKEFYRNRTEESNTHLINIVQPKYENFSEEILAKYKSYQLQCSSCWLELLFEFRRMFSDFQCFLDTFYFIDIKKYVEKQRNQMNNEFQEMMRKLENELSKLENFYMDIHNKLKVSYGHQQAKDRLDFLDNCMAEAEDFTVNSVIVYIEPFKEKIKSHCKNTEEILNNMEQILRNIKTDESLAKMQLVFEKNFIKQIKKLEDEITNNAIKITEEQIEVKKEVEKQILLYKKKLGIPFDIKNSSGSIIKFINDSVNHENDFANVRDIISNSNTDCEKYIEKLETVRTKCRETHFKYKHMWRLDVERIKNLFKLKYDFVENI